MNRKNSQFHDCRFHHGWCFRIRAFPLFWRTAFSEKGGETRTRCAAKLGKPGYQAITGDRLAAGVNGDRRYSPGNPVSIPLELRDKMNPYRQRQRPASTLAVARFLLTMSYVGLLASWGPEQALADALEERSTVANYETVLRDAGVPAIAAGAIELVSRYKAPDTEPETVSNLISQLGSDHFHTRQQAKLLLLSLGDAAKQKLLESALSSDLEIILQSELILSAIKSRTNLEVREKHLVAAFQALTALHHKDAVKTILGIFPELHSKTLRKHASLALWFAVSTADEERIRNALKASDNSTRIAAIPALEIVTGEASLPALRPLLKSPLPAVRLSAARALFDHLPQECMQVLLELLDVAERSTKLQAAWLIAKAFREETVSQSKFSFNEQADRWKKRFARERDSEITYLLGKERHALDEYLAGFQENFDIAAKSITSNYGQMKYVTTVDGATASVRDGIARLDGKHNEGDQRLLIAAPRVVGQKTFTETFTVVAEIGGEGAGAGAYHVGVSIGNLRVLFHPGYPGGGFRVQRVDNQQFLIPNKVMSFTPIGGNLYTMRIEVSPSTNNIVRLKTTILDPKSPNDRFTNLYFANRNDIGKIETVGVERSGRLGGAALIGSFAIDTSGIQTPEASAKPESK